MEVHRLAKLFDHSIVRPDASLAEVQRSAETAARLGTASLTVQAREVLELGADEIDIVRTSPP